MRKVLAVASGGGHWIQLMRLYDSLADHNVKFMTTNIGFKKDVNEDVFVVRDANLDKKMDLLFMFFQVFFNVLVFRPDVIISTGAAPGFAAIVVGKFFGAKTIWIDSIANHDCLSTSGKKVGRFADVWLTQWEHLASDEGPSFEGKVI